MTPEQHRATAETMMSEGYWHQYTAYDDPHPVADAIYTLADEVGYQNHLVCALTHAVLAVSARRDDA